MSTALATRSGTLTRAMTSTEHYVVVGTKSWNRRVFDEVISRESGEWTYIDTLPGVSALADTRPRYAFFLHWSSIVPDSVLENCECVVFHMTDVPFGRGGSPLQNLIERGIRTTRLSAIRMTADLDAGPVYLKRDLPLDGTAEHILIRSSEIAAEMISEIVSNRPTPVPQVGEPVVFRRRKPEASEISGLGTLDDLHDFIRMLDGEGYPPAFIRCGSFRFEFTGASRYEGRVEARVRIVPDGADR